MSENEPDLVPHKESTKDRRNQPVQVTRGKRSTYHTSIIAQFPTAELLNTQIDRKSIEELALYSIGRFFHEKPMIELEDYLRLEFLLHCLTGDRALKYIKNQRQLDLSVALSMILKYAIRDFDDSNQVLSHERLVHMIFAKTRSSFRKHLDLRAHGSRSFVWSTRFYEWIKIRIVSELAENRRGKMYDSYTKGYKDGSTLRPEDPSKFQVLDRTHYSDTSHPPNLEVWDRDEFVDRL